MPDTDPLEGARRIMVYGVTGSGKTVAAERLGRATAIPWHCVDDLTWEPGWVQVEIDEQRRRIAAICDQAEWVIDSAYGQWLEIPLARVELVVALDYPRWLSLLRLVRRTGRRVWDKQEVCNGNTESLRNTFAWDSILLWHFRSFARKRERIAQWAADPDGPRVLRFRRPDDLQRWIESLAVVPR